MAGEAAVGDGALGSPSPAAAAIPVVELVSGACVLPESVRVVTRDDKIKCICTPGTKRDASDMLKIKQSNSFIWVHMKCQPLRGEMSKEAASTFDEVVYRTEHAHEDPDEMRVLTENMLAITLDSNSTQQQLKQVRNVTTKFHCDGPCRGSFDHKEWFWCHLCCGWQHNECKLFGDEGDKGRRICNPCYLNHMLHEEEQEAWRKERLAKAAMDALAFLRTFRDPDYYHHLLTWQPREEQARFASQFLAKFLYKNRQAYVKFVVNRRRVVRFIKARRGLPQPTYTGRTPTTPASNVPSAPATAPTAPPTRRARKRPVVKSEVSTDDSTPIRDNGESSVASTIAVGKAAARVKPTRSSARQPKRPAAPVIPLDDDSNSSDDEQNERIQRAVALKARKEAAVAGESSSQASTLKPTLKQRAPVKLPILPNRWEATLGPQEFDDIEITPNQMRQNLMQADKNRSRHARKSAPSTGREFAASTMQDEYQDEEEPSATTNPRPRKKGKQNHVAFKETDNDEEPGATTTAPPRKKAKSKRVTSRKETQVSSDETDLARLGASIDTIPDGDLEQFMSATAIPDAPGDGYLPPTPMMPGGHVKFDSMSSAQPSTLTVTSAVPFTSELARPALDESVPAERAPPPGVLFSQPPQQTQAMPSEMPPQPPPSSVQPASMIAQTGSSTFQPRAVREVAATQAASEPIDEAMKNEVRALCSTILWDAYCDLPDPNESNDGFDRPKTPPPADWLAEAEKRLTIMFEASGSAKINEYLRAEFQAWPRNSINIMRSLRDFGLWARMKGPFRRTRKDLGLLEEILGFADKGKYWALPEKPKDERSSSAGAEIRL